MPLSVSITSVTRNGPMGVTVAGTGSPNGANIAVTVKINGGPQGNAATIVSPQGTWTTPVMIQTQVGQTGTATATATDSSFPGQSVTDTMDFTL